MVQLVLSGSGSYPQLQYAHSVAPGLDEKEPGGQAWQVDWLSENVPGGQGSHPVLLANTWVPGGQVSHVQAPSLEVNSPNGHS